MEVSILPVAISGGIPQLRLAAPWADIDGPPTFPDGSFVQLGCKKYPVVTVSQVIAFRDGNAPLPAPTILTSTISLDLGWNKDGQEWIANVPAASAPGGDLQTRIDEYPVAWGSPSASDYQAYIGNPPPEGWQGEPPDGWEDPSGDNYGGVTGCIKGLKIKGLMGGFYTPRGGGQTFGYYDTNVVGGALWPNSGVKIYRPAGFNAGANEFDLPPNLDPYQSPWWIISRVLQKKDIAEAKGWMAGFHGSGWYKTLTYGAVTPPFVFGDPDVWEVIETTNTTRTVSNGKSTRTDTLSDSVTSQDWLDACPGKIFSDAWVAGREEYIEPGTPNPPLLHGYVEREHLIAWRLIGITEPFYPPTGYVTGRGSCTVLVLQEDGSVAEETIASREIGSGEWETFGGDPNGYAPGYHTMDVSGKVILEILEVSGEASLTAAIFAFAPLT